MKNRILGFFSTLFFTSPIILGGWLKYEFLQFPTEKAGFFHFLDWKTPSLAIIALSLFGGVTGFNQLKKLAEKANQFSWSGRKFKKRNNG
ncbi:MAG: hypothetical protein K6L73_05170 [Cellvibrionaceae bacterium]